MTGGLLRPAAKIESEWPCSLRGQGKARLPRCDWRMQSHLGLGSGHGGPRRSWLRKARRPPQMQPPARGASYHSSGRSLKAPGVVGHGVLIQWAYGLLHAKHGPLTEIYFVP